MAVEKINNDLNVALVMVLKRLRAQNHLTQETIYNDTGIHISRIEKDKPDLRISTITTLATYFDISLSELFMLVEKMK